MPQRAKRHLRVAALAVACIVLAGAAACGPPQALTSSPYTDLIGTEYRVITDDLYAYGIYSEDWPNRTITHVTVIPGAGIAGRDIAFRKHIEKGTVLRLLSAWHQPLVFDNGVFYRIAVTNADLPHDIPIKLELYIPTNEGIGLDLNPRFYEKLPRRPEQ